VGTFIQAQYDDLAVKSQDVYAQTKWDILEKYLAGHKDLRILNVGCGSGELSLRLAEKGHHVVGIDPEPAYVELALANASRSGHASRCSFEVASIEDYQGAGGFDCAVATDVLEHIADDRAAFTRMIGLLRPGGLVLVTVPAGQWLFGYHDEQLGHFRRYSKRTLRALVDPLCSVEKMRYFGFTLVPVCYLYSKRLRRPYPVAESSDPRRRPVRSFILRCLMKMDRCLPMPLGTSLLMKGVKK
jgi:2-polyprenyl-3-methyl-5-hydroxy-6-metoxy-1,4-benzoquinol methylase